MAAGKTVVGRRLARSLGWSFLDLDAVIEAKEGRAVRDIFSGRYSGGRETDAVIRGLLTEEVLGGEHYFRELEKEALSSVLEGSGQVIALGGGAVVDPNNLTLLKQRSLLIWLRVSPRTVLGRVGRTEDRPLLQGPDRLKRIKELSAQREGIYAEAHVAVDTDGLTVDQVVQRIQQQLCRP
ncbi:MAG: shikimate kinase [Deltaproteobacteria bacterium]|nr:shikimate kinase [Deltaproteobacteria bacterium]